MQNNYKEQERIYIILTCVMKAIIKLQEKVKKMFENFNILFVHKSRLFVST